jgi:hypothetical protein
LNCIPAKDLEQIVDGGRIVFYDRQQQRMGYHKWNLLCGGIAREAKKRNLDFMSEYNHATGTFSFKFFKLK